MPAIGGSIQSIGLDGREFSVPADADINKNFGGFENEVLSNGDGSARMTKTRKPWSFSGVQVSVDDSLNEQETLEELRDRLDYFPITVTMASGITYSGRGQITGEFNCSTQTQVATFDLMGPNKLTQV